MASPGCDAVMVQEPAVVIVTKLADTVHPPDALKTTGRPDDALAVTVNKGSAYVAFGKASNAIVWFNLP